MSNKDISTKEVFNTKTVVKKLESYMDKVTEKDCTPATVQAAVNCADKICDFLRLHLEVERLRIKRGDRDET
jgi:hypothetical protein